jgi:protein involved in polysaccharide export with SLBB domain
MTCSFPFESIQRNDCLQNNLQPIKISTQSNYIHVFLPWARQHRVATDPQLWYLGTRSDPEGSIFTNVDKTGNYWVEHGRAYDALVAWAKMAKGDAKDRSEALPKGAAAKQEKAKNDRDHVATSGNEARAATGASPKANRIEPLDVLTVWARGTLLDQPIRGRFLVEPSGKVSLGPAYGRVAVKGLTIQEAEAAVKKHLEEILQAPEVEVLAAGRATRWPGETPKLRFHIRRSDLLRISGIGTLLDEPLCGDFLVDADGKVDLGKTYGSVAIKGLALEEAEQAILKQLKTMLSRPEVSVTLTGWKREPKGSK